ISAERMASLGEGRLRQPGQGRAGRRRRRGAAGETVAADHYASITGMWPVDPELPRPERAKTFDHMFRHRGVVRIAAAIPAPRGEPPKRLVDARDPRFLGPAGVTHEAVPE